MAVDEPVAIRSSIVALAAQSGLAGAAILSLAMIPVPLLVQVLAAIAVSAVCSLVIRRHAILRDGRSIRAIKPLPAGRCMVTDLSGIETEGEILPDSVAWSWMLLLRIALVGKHLPVGILLLRDSVTDADWRRLSIWLRWQASGRAA